MAGPNQGPGDLAKVAGQTLAEKIAEGLLKATDKKWPDLLRAARDERGGQYTAALVAVAGTCVHPLFGHRSTLLRAEIHRGLYVVAGWAT